MENKLTAEQIEKIKECKNMEELKKLVQTENIELTDEELDEVVGGTEKLSSHSNEFLDFKCTNCGNVIAFRDVSKSYTTCKCCGNTISRDINKTTPTDPTIQMLF